MSTVRFSASMAYSSSPSVTIFSRRSLAARSTCNTRTFFQSSAVLSVARAVRSQTSNSASLEPAAPRSTTA